MGVQVELGRPSPLPRVGPGGPWQLEAALQVPLAKLSPVPGSPPARPLPKAHTATGRGGQRPRVLAHTPGRLMVGWADHSLHGDGQGCSFPGDKGKEKGHVPPSVPGGGSHYVPLLKANVPGGAVLEVGL